jgi:predicted Zn finger-like uncharacterized protein
VFTQCSNCETVFKLSAEVLRAAGGQVRCGNCGEVFNALARLAEDANSFSVGAESSHALETRADSILESPAPSNPEPEPDDGEDFGPPGVEIARLQILDWNTADGADNPGIDEDIADEAEVDIEPEEPEPPENDNADSDPSMEFTLPPGELDRIFVESKKKQAAQATPPTEDLAEFELDLTPVPTPVESLSTPTPPLSQETVSATSVSTATRPPPPPKPRAPALPPHPESLPPALENAAPSGSGLDVPDAVRFEILSGMESARPLHELAQPNRTRGLSLWIAAAVSLGLLLAAQVVHHNREYFAAHGPLAAALRAIYARAGAPVSSPANLSAYQLRQWGVSGDPSADGTLRVRASILNGAAQLEPFPLLRVTLANRFGTSIGARDFEPSEYLGKPTARYLNPGEQVDATMDILDPGKNAEGFEIDVCLRGADRKISCANDATPAQTKR